MSLRALYDVPAPAKLNLFLHVVGRRPDGYHLLQSVFVLIDWCDTLHFEHRDDRTLQRHDLGPDLPPDDLCLRAARLLQTESGTSFGADISIRKRVPWGAGMGGGSSDAASTLLALNRLWQLNWPRARLLALAQQLGADVPFFVGGHNAFVEGIGEKLSPIKLPRLQFAVVKPDAEIETRAIFQSPLLVRDTPAVILAGFLAGTAGLNPGSLAIGHDDWGRNDLQPPAEASCPAVAEVARWLHRRFGNSRMTGSGSAVFARVADPYGAGDPPMATWTKDLPSNWVGRMCRSLDEHPLAGWAD